VIVLDSSVWIERWRRPDARAGVDAALQALGMSEDPLLVPATVVFETRRWLIRNVDDVQRVDAISALLDAYESVPMDASIARLAALTSVTTGLAHADATILASARSRHATLLTYDTDFAGIADVLVLDH
jgi:uncharacterized protein